MIKKLFIASLLIVALPVSAQTYPSWVGSTGGNFYNQTTVSQTPGATLSTPNASVGVPGSVGGYTPLEPILNQWGGTRYNSFSDYLATIYRLVITIGALIAVVMLVTGGVRYMLSEGFTDIDKAKLRIRSALYGLLVLVGSFLILYTINPNLLNFSVLNTLPPLKNQGPSNFSVATGNSGGGSIFTSSSGKDALNLTDAERENITANINKPNAADCAEARASTQPSFTKVLAAVKATLNNTVEAREQTSRIVGAYIESCIKAGY